MSKIRESARGEACQLRLDGCNPGPENETVVFSHLPNGSMGLKALDIHGFYACHNCHAKYERDWLDHMGLQAMKRTQEILLEKGLINFE